jgi:hypothetical protein
MKSLYVLISVLMIISCSSTRGKGMMTGNDRDEHGCIGSAGYTWSEVRKDCIRLFEDGMEVKDARSPEGEATYAVFSRDSSKVEIFAVYNKKSSMLVRDGNQWNGKNMILMHASDGWKLMPH